ncbi:MAG: glycosyltransferase family 4 protein [Deltaproteobacteria bacterium]|nr:glycosyltransferase family 4 protein [Deltaproteobacteria bacterium]MBW2063933.1 glycosyltransferase family 4 protein [Deltaproteobacteria bacterium]
MKILYLETGTFGGGSFESLYQMLKVINRKRFSPIVAFLNANRICGQLDEIDVGYYVFSDPVYSRNFGRIMNKSLSKMSQKIGIFSGFLSVIYEFLTHNNTIRVLTEIVKKHSIEILHLNDQINRDFFALFVAKRTGIKCVSHLRSPDTYGFNKKKSILANGVVVHYIACSEWIMDLWANCGVAREKISVVPNGIDISKQIEAIDLHARYNIPRDNAIIGCVGTLIPNRGYDFMIRSFAKLVEVFPKAKLLIVGDGSERMFRELKGIANSLRIGDRITFAGFDKNGKGIIAGLDVLVLPYRNEAFGRTLLEAWLAKTPVIATNFGNMNRIVNHGYNGMLVSYGDTESLNRSLLEILKNKQIGEGLRRGGYETVKERFGIQGHVGEIERIYSVIQTNSDVS